MASTLATLSLPSAAASSTAGAGAGASHRCRVTIRCGPRSNRGPLVKGRILSTEAIQAVQTLKRSDPSQNDAVFSKTLSRLIKSDLLATLRELLRQNHCTLALRVFSAVRLEPWYKTDLGLYSELVSALGKANMWEDIDCLIEGLDEVEGVIDCGDKKGLVKLIKSLIAADRGESTVRIYGVMKRSGWGCVESGVEVDEYVGKILSKGLRRFGEMGLACEVDLAVQRYTVACLGKNEANGLGETGLRNAGHVERAAR